MDPTSAQTTTTSSATAGAPTAVLTGKALRVAVWVITSQVALQPTR